MSCKTDEVAIQVNHVTKIYKIFDTPGKRFLYHMLHTNSGSDFVALDDVSFEVRKGESFGIIGRNGSGKSTMLQILAGIIKATKGEVIVNGKVAALLELGSGFNPESTGYENIYMNAAILGVNKEDIDAKVSEIIDFADIGDFVNQPVKTYSSGMFIRLAFAVAINVDADILLIDEALAVGDVFFRQKCYTKLNKLKDEGKTIVLVSHGMNEVEQFCDRALLLNKSKMVMLDDSRKVVQKYYVIDQERGEKSEGVTKDSESNERELSFVNNRFSSGWEMKEDVFNCSIDYNRDVNSGKAKFIRIGIFDEEGYSRNVFHQGEEAYFVYEVEVFQDIDVPMAGIVFYDQKNTIVFGKDNLQTYTVVPSFIKKDSIVKVLFKIRLDIATGEYTFDAGFNCLKLEDYQQRGDRNQEAVNETIERLSILTKVGSFAIHERTKGDPMKLLFHGCCDLNTDIELMVN